MIDFGLIFTIMKWAALVIALIYILPSVIVITPQQHAKVIETFGKFSGIRHAGLSFKLPWPIQRVAHTVTLQIMENGNDVTVKSRDNAFLSVPIRVQFRVPENDASIRDAVYRLDNPARQIQSYVMNTVRSVAAEMDMNEIFRSKDAFETEVQSSLSERMGEYGYEIVNVLVDDPMPSEEVRRSFDRVISSTRLKEAAQNEADAEKVRRVGVAEAQKQALELTGQGLANMPDEIAKGHARAIQDLIRETGLSAIQASDYLAKAFETEAFREAAEHGGRTVYIGAGVGGQTPMSLLVNPSDDGDERPTARQRANAKNDLPPTEHRIG